jgi:hypothetical protein
MDGATASGASGSLRRFFVLASVLLLPFLAYGAATDLQLAPGLPVAAIGVVCPLLAAVAVVSRHGGRRAVGTLLSRAVDAGRIPSAWWYAPLLLVMPSVMALSFWVQRWTGVAVPAPQLSVGPALLLCLGLLVGAAAEEIGWSGYATEAMRARWSALRTGVLLGAFWAVYHYPALLQAHRAVDWIAWWTLYAVANRVIMVWLFDRTGRSVFAMVIYHTTINATWLLYPVDGSFFDPRVTAPILAALAIGVTLIGTQRPRGG